MITLAVVLLSGAILATAAAHGQVDVLCACYVVCIVAVVILVRDCWLAAAELELLRAGGRSGPIRRLYQREWWSSLGRRLERLLAALRYQQESSAWELQAATRDIVRTPAPRVSFLDERRSEQDWIAALLDRLSGEFRHAAAVVSSSAGLWIATGRIGATFRQSFEHEYPLRLQGKCSGGRPLALEVLGFGSSLVESFSCGSERVILWLGYVFERPPTALERTRIKVIAHELYELLSTLREKGSLVQRVSAAEQRSEGQLKLIAEVSHDIRSPLSNLKAILNVFKIEGVTSDSTQLLDMALVNCEALDEIVSALIDLSRLQSGSLSVRRERLNVSRVMEQVIGVFAASARLKGLSLESVVEFDTPEVEVDRVQLSRILSNLVSNAIKYTQQGSVCLIAKATEEARVRIEVSDTGVGLTAPQLEALFTPFQRFHPGLADGVGLGLALTKSLVALNDGLLSVKSSPGNGSTFIVELPAAADTRRIDVQGTAETRVKEPVLRVLVVDDDRDCVDTLARGLKSRGFHIRKAYSVEEAIRWMNGGEIDVVISDLRMPQGGAEALIPHRHQANRSITVLVLSGDDRDASRIESLGVEKVFLKPVDLPTLVHWLQDEQARCTALRAA